MGLEPPTSGDYRCRTPLYFIDCPIDERLKLADDLVFAPLDEPEAARVHSALCLEHDVMPKFRLEVQVPNSGQTAECAYDQGAAVLHRAMALLAIVTRATPEWPEPVVDEYQKAIGAWKYQSNVGEAWLAYPPPKHSGGLRPQEFWLAPEPVERFFAESRDDCYWVNDTGMMCWRDTIASFPRSESARQLHIAVVYLYDALCQVAGDPVTAFLNASIALEALLGDANAELSYRLALRGAHLVGSDSAARQVLFAQLRAAYSERSRLVHEGREPSVGCLLELLDFMCTAVPAYAKLQQSAGSRKSALAALDSAVVSGVGLLDD